MEAQAQDIGDFDQERAIATYQQLITELPPLNRQLLLYILDLLSVFTSKSDINLMTSANLSAIFQPGLLSHPSHDMSPREYRLSQDVLIFLIDNQDSFLIGMRGTAADENTVREVQNGGQTQQPTTPTSGKVSQTGLGRSASNASAGADSLRKCGGIRRNVSVSSKNSKKSTNIPSPVTPSSGTAFASNNTGSGVYRSNTVPSKKSPALSAPRYSRGLDSPTSPPITLTSNNPPASIEHSVSSGSKLNLNTSETRTESVSFSTTPRAEHPRGLTLSRDLTYRDQSKDRLLPHEHQEVRIPSQSEESEQAGTTPVKVRKISGLLNKSPSENERKESRQPRKLQKKRMPSSTTPSAHSSTNSLHQGQESLYTTPMPIPGFGSQMQIDQIDKVMPTLHNTAATPQSKVGPQFGDTAQDLHLASSDIRSTLRPNKSPVPSLHSKSSTTDHSDPDQTGEYATAAEKTAKKSKWRFSSSAKKNGQSTPVAASASSQIGSNDVAERSTNSIGSWQPARKSITNDTQQTTTDFSSVGLSTTSVQPQSSNDSPLKEKEVQEPAEKKGPLGWIKAKVAQAKEDRKEREAEKERTKSPPRIGGDRTGSKNSLSAIAQDSVPRGRSMDVSREAQTLSEVESASTAPGVHPPP